jgi:multidrug efflux pump subunit AcrA (membrane-fusion protein)
VPVRAALDGVDACLHANQYVRVSATPAADANAAVSVASSAILRLGSADHVFVDGGGSYRAVPVTVVQAQGDRTWVRAKDLQAGAQVVSQGVAALKGHLQGLGTPAAAP